MNPRQNLSKALLVIGLPLLSSAALPKACFAACAQPMSTVEESQCAQTAAEKATRKMQKSLNRALAAAGKMAEDGHTTIDFRPDIRESQILWEKWQESQCNLEADVIMGSAAAHIGPECRQRLTIERAQSLDDIAKHLESLL